MPIRYLFWDFDGTLADTYSLLTDELTEALHQLAPDYSPAWEHVYRELKVTVSHACRCFAEKACISPIVLEQTFAGIHQSEILGPENLYTGTVDCLKALRDNGCTHYLYTNRNARAIQTMRACQLDSLFSGYMTSEDGFPLKPEPDALLAAMERLHFLPEEAVMIGDRDIDLESGRRAGIRGILFDPDNYYPNEPADWRVSDMAQMKALLLSLSESK